MLVMDGGNIASLAALQEVEGRRAAPSCHGSSKVKCDQGAECPSIICQALRSPSHHSPVLATGESFLGPERRVVCSGGPYLQAPPVMRKRTWTPWWWSSTMGTLATLLSPTSGCCLQTSRFSVSPSALQGGILPSWISPYGWSLGGLLLGPDISSLVSQEEVHGEEVTPAAQR